jgi:hypothetical protein
MSMLGGGFNPLVAVMQSQQRQQQEAAQQTAGGQPQTPGMIVWEFPVKGRDSNTAYRDTPQGTCVDCLNVLAYDPTTIRARGGQRQGLLKLYSTGVGANGFPVTQMAQAVFENIQVVVLDDQFSYPNGSLPVVSGNLYALYVGENVTNGYTPVAGKFAGGEGMFMGPATGITTPSVQVNQSSGGIIDGAWGNRPLSLLYVPSETSNFTSNAFSMQATLNMPSAQSNYFSLGCRINPTPVNTDPSGVPFYTGLQAFVQATSTAVNFYLVEVSSVSGARSENIVSNTATTPGAVGLTFGQTWSVLLNVAGSNVSISAGAGSSEPTVDVLNGSSVFNSQYFTFGIGAYQNGTATGTVSLASVGMTVSQLVVATASGPTAAQDIFLANDLFAYGSGTYLQKATSTPSGTAWLTYESGPAGTAANGTIGKADTTAWLCQGSNTVSTSVTVPANTGFQSGGNFAVYNSNLAIGAINPYIVSGQFQYNIANTGGLFFMMTRFGAPGSSNAANGVYIQYLATTNGAATVSVIDDGGNVYGNSGAISSTYAASGIPIILSAFIEGSAYDISVNGTSVLSCNCSYALSTPANGYTGFGAISGTKAQAFTMSQFQVLSSSAIISFRQTDLVMTDELGNIYQGTGEASISTPVFGLVQNGANALVAESFPVPQIAVGGGYAFLVDGTNLLQLNLSTQSVAPLVTTAGTAPTGCQLACIWHGRLALARPTGQEQNWYLSRIGVYTDFAYQTPTGDPAAAFASTSGTIFGAVGEQIVALIPLNDDILMFGTVGNMFAMVGDPGSGGVVDHFIQGIGIFGPNAWTFDTVGTLYWIGNGGLYRLMKGYTIPECLSATVCSDYFAGLDQANLAINMCWYEDYHQLWIFASSTVSNTAPGVHLVWEQRTGGFFPQQFGPLAVADALGVFCALVFEGDHPQDRRILIGCRDGYVRKYTGNCALQTVLNDDGNIINSYVYLGPNRPVDDLNEAKILALDVYAGMEISGSNTSTFSLSSGYSLQNTALLSNGPGGLPGTSSYNMNYTLQAAPDAYNAVFNPTATQTTMGVNTQGHSKDRSMRMRGGSFCLVVWNETINTTWNFERFVATMTKGAPQR